jgi:hypothetical protein
LFEAASCDLMNELSKYGKYLYSPRHENEESWHLLINYITYLDIILSLFIYVFIYLSF